MSTTNLIQPKRSLAEIIAAKRKAEGQLEGTTSTPIQATPATAPTAPIPLAAPASNPLPVSLKERIAALNAAVQAKHEQEAKEYKEVEEQQQEQAQEIASEAPQAETFSLSISLNKEQLLAKDLAFSGKSFCLIGAAGTGKTTAQREIAASLIAQNLLSVHSFRVQGAGIKVDAPSIAFVAYTRIAAGNLRRAIHKDPELEAILTHNITTIHNLLEYEPETYFDYEENKEKFRFVPRRTASNPLDITHLIIEESSMVGLDLWQQLFDALRTNVQIIFIGDINQLPPVFGPSVLNYALVQLPIIELTHVYRQKGDSSILENAHKILSGDCNLTEDEGTKIIRGGDKQFSQAKMALAFTASLKKWYSLSEYDPEQDIILSPFNKQDLGTDSLNKYISQFLGEQRNAVVYELICGIAKLYLAEGDKVLYNKQVGIVTSIKRNMEYVGRSPKQASTNLSRFGVYTGALGSDDEPDEFELASYENISIEQLAAQAEESEKKRQSSHIVELMMETGIPVTLSAVGDFSPQSFSLGYALTIHKAQGCEWRKVYVMLHKDHSIMAFRELLYTACTRAREQLVLITKDYMIEKAIAAQRIKGNTLKEKVAYFNAGLLGQENIQCTK